MTDVAAWPSATSPMTPLPHQVCARVVENFESTTIHLQPTGRRLPRPRPGQFMMLYAFGIGEIAMSVSYVPTGRRGTTGHTIRAVGAVSRALHDSAVGTTVGVRGPFGTDWGLYSCTGRDLVVVAGGCGLAPLRPVIAQTLTERAKFGRVIIVAGARTPQHLLFSDEAAAWCQEQALETHLIVDSAGPDWPHQVGVVTEPLRRLNVNPERTAAFICGPEPMMRFSAQALLDKGVAPQDIRVSLERNMQCGIGWCGHCQLGPLLLCRQGPIVSYHRAEPLLRVQEL